MRTAIPFRYRLHTGHSAGSGCLEEMSVSVGQTRAPTTSFLYGSRKLCKFATSGSTCIVIFSPPIALDVDPDLFTFPRHAWKGPSSIPANPPRLRVVRRHVR